MQDFDKIEYKDEYLDDVYSAIQHKYYHREEFLKQIDKEIQNKQHLGLNDLMTFDFSSDELEALYRFKRIYEEEVYDLLLFSRIYTLGSLTREGNALLEVLGTNKSMRAITFAPKEGKGVRIENNFLKNCIEAELRNIIEGYIERVLHLTSLIPVYYPESISLFERGGTRQDHVKSKLRKIYINKFEKDFQAIIEKIPDDRRGNNKKKFVAVFMGLIGLINLTSENHMLREYNNAKR